MSEDPAMVRQVATDDEFVLWCDVDEAANNDAVQSGLLDLLGHGRIEPPRQTDAQHQEHRAQDAVVGPARRHHPGRFRWTTSLVIHKTPVGLCG